jgi:hypothetical protein
MLCDKALKKLFGNNITQTKMKEEKQLLLLTFDLQAPKEISDDD